MMNLEKQNQNVNHLLQLIKENPDLPIVPMVATECVCDDSYRYWMAEFGTASVTKYCVSNRRIYDYDEFDELVEDWIDNNCGDYADLSDDELTKLAESKVNGYAWVDAIVVCIENI
jgi:hypothetical protein